jgi:predicted peptidase
MISQTQGGELQGDTPPKAGAAPQSVAQQGGQASSNIESMPSKMETINADKRNELLPVLTADQLKKYDEYMAANPRGFVGGGPGRPQRTPPSVSPDVFEARTFSDEKYEHSLPYRLFIPDSYDPSKTYPLVLFLHGAGERGTDNTIQLTANNGAAVWADPNNQSANPCFVLAPQCPDNEQWVDTPWGLGSYDIEDVMVSDEILMVMDIINDLKKEFNIDATRIYSTGLSMGGYGTWDINLRYPNVFAAALPVCGAGDPSKAALIASKPIWAFHGDQDNTVPVAADREMIQALKNAGGSPKYSEYSGVGHGAWDPAYAEGTLISWTFAQRLKVK